MVNRGLAVALSVNARAEVDVRHLAGVLRDRLDQVAVLLHRRALTRSQGRVPVLIRHVSILLKSATGRDKVRIPAFNNFKKVRVSEGIRIMVILPGLIGTSRAARLVSVAVLQRHVRSTFSVTHARLIILAILDRVLKNVRGGRVIVITILTRRRRSDKGTHTGRSIH